MPATSKVGNLTADPELRYSDKGTAYCRMRLAVTAPVTPGDWKGEKETTFYGITAFGSLATNAAESLSKGDRVIVSGQGEIDEWTDKDGVIHKEKKIVADGLGADLRWVTVQIQKAQRLENKPVKSEDDKDDAF